MKIGVVLDRFDPSRGGAERALADFVAAANAAGHEVWTFALSFGDDAPWQRMRVLVPLRLRGARDRVFAQRAVESAQAVSCDVILGVRHVTGVDVYWPHGGVHAETLAAVERSKGRVGGAVSRVLHGISPKQRALLALERRFFGDPRGARIWCVSDLVRREIAARWPDCAPLVEMHPNGVDVDVFHPRLRDEHRARVRRELKVDDDTPLVLFLGGAWRLKGWPVLLDALTSISGEKWVCVAAGARHESAARAVARARLSKRVRVLPQTDSQTLYAAADLFVQPTWRDPCSLATLEALACGVPVVTTDANGAADAFAELPAAGDVVPAGDVDALARAIARRLAVLREPNASARRAAERRRKDAWLAGLLRSLEAAATACR